MSAWPSEIRLNPAKDTLRIVFEDGADFSLAAQYLRVESPSAEVQGHGGAKQIVTGKENVKIDRLEPVGNYALRIVFDDGHDSGLFAWDYLYRLGREHDAIWAEHLRARGP
jgi:DUF971 family protein